MSEEVAAAAEAPAAPAALAPSAPTAMGPKLSPEDELREAALKLRAAQRSLLLLVSLEEAVATRILAHLNPDEVRRLREASEGLQEVDAVAILGVHQLFVDAIQGGVPTSLRGSSAYLRRLAGKALGEGKVAELWSDIQLDDGPVAALSTLDVPTLLAILEYEHPQTLAVILSQIEPTRGSELMARFPLEKQSEILVRMSRLQGVPESVITEIEKQFASEIAALGDTARRDLNGVKAAANLVKRMDNELGEALLEEVAATDHEMAEDLRKQLFTFEDLMRIDGRGMQQLLKEVATDQLTLALKSASENLREKIFGNVSSRAASMIREELELLGPVRLSDVEEAQQAIVDVALNLEKENRISIAREGGGDYV
ncbi:MAG: FliG C-terminal domain-containing protein [Myxococcota bacterium]